MWQQSVKQDNLLLGACPLLAFIESTNCGQLQKKHWLKHRNFQSVSFSLEEICVFEE